MTSISKARIDVEIERDFYNGQLNHHFLNERVMVV